MLESGELLNGRYRLEELLGRGGMGEVWRATDLRLARTVAIKACLSEPDARFTTEARVMASLHHPRIVNIYDYGDFYLVMEFVDGQPLSRLLDERGPLDSATAARLVSQVAEALQVVHEKGIVHRDVKPANILLDSDGNAKLTDFGVAASGQGGGAVQGTARYMAPEQAMGHQVTPAADIYALGAVAYHCVSGVPPFTGDDAVEVALRHIQDAPPPLPESTSPALREAIMRAMAKQPDDRFPAASDFASAVSPESGLDSTRPLRPWVPTPPPSSPRHERRRRGALVTIMAAIALIALGGLLIAATLNGTPSDGQPVQPPAAPASDPNRAPGRDQPGPAPGGTDQEQVLRPSPTPTPSRTPGASVTGPSPTRTTNSPAPQQSPPAPTGAPTTPAPEQDPDRNNPDQNNPDQNPDRNSSDRNPDQEPQPGQQPRR